MNSLGSMSGHSEKFEEQYGYEGTPGSLLINREGIVVGRSMFRREEIEPAVSRSTRGAGSREGIDRRYSFALANRTSLTVNCGRCIVPMPCDDLRIGAGLSVRS